MKVKTAVLFTLLTIIPGACTNTDLATNKSKSDIRSEISKDIAALSNDLEKQQYLEQIHKGDQKYRIELDRGYLSQYDEDSKEYLEFMKAFKSMDSLNLLKVEAYFSKFGYPKKEQVGNNAARTPWLVIHHAYDYEPRENHFSTLYQAYLNGDIEEGLMHMYIGRMYKMKNGKDFKYLSRNSLRKEMDMMMTDLGLHHLVVFTELHYHENLSRNS